MTTPHCTKTRRGLGQNGLSTNGYTGNDVRKDWRKRARGTRKGKDVKSMEFELDRKRASVIKVNRRLIRGVGNNDNAIKEFSFG